MMTYEEILDKYIRKLGRDITAGEVVFDLRHLEQPQMKLIDAVERVKAFFENECRTKYSFEMIFPDGKGRVTDWGYFEEGLKYIEEYARSEGREDGKAD